MAHIFISYVHEDQAVVDRLANRLGQAGLEVWLDREQIRPGQRWQDAIRRAIVEGAYFLACFSNAYGQRSRSYANEELTIAIEELRRRPVDRTWFIPVRLDDCSVPDRPISAGETLHDIQWVDLHVNWDDGIRRLLEAMDGSAVVSGDGTLDEVVGQVRRKRFSSEQQRPRFRFVASHIAGFDGPIDSLEIWNDGSAFQGLEIQQYSLLRISRHPIGSGTETRLLPVYYFLHRIYSNSQVGRVGTFLAFKHPAEIYQTEGPINVTTALAELANGLGAALDGTTSIQVHTCLRLRYGGDEEGYLIRPPFGDPSDYFFSPPVSRLLPHAIMEKIIRYHMGMAPHLQMMTPAGIADGWSALRFDEEIDSYLRVP